MARRGPEETMYSMTTMEATLLGLALLVVTSALVLGVLAGFPRSLQTLAAGVICPVVGRSVDAEVVRDRWTVRCVDVRRCTVLGRRVDLCSKGCL
jgi:hypothetical protein